MNKSALDFAKKQIRYLKKSEKINKRIFSLLYILLSSINLTIVIIACVALGILISNWELNENKTSIIMASLTAFITILIFVFNIVNIVYRSVMKWENYKEAIDKIQLEYIQYVNSVAEYKNLDNKKAQNLFEEQCRNFYNQTLNLKKKSNKKKIIAKAIAGGKNE